MWRWLGALLACAALAGCATSPCVGLELRAQPVFDKGFEAPEWWRRKQWDDVVAYMRCTSPAPSLTMREKLLAAPKVHTAWQPQDVRFLFDDDEQLRQVTLRLAGERKDTQLEQWVARSYEQASMRKEALSVYESAMLAKKDFALAHDVAFGMLHGWDGGNKDEWAAMYWYGVAAKKAGRQDSAQACLMLKKKLSAHGGFYESCGVEQP